MKFIVGFEKNIKVFRYKYGSTYLPLDTSTSIAVKFINLRVIKLATFTTLHGLYKDELIVCGAYSLSTGLQSYVLFGYIPETAPNSWMWK